MKVLPRKVDIDKARAQERKLEIDAGLSLAKRVDALRETKLQEEKNLREWRENSIKAVQYEIDQYCEERENLRKQNDAARQLRDKLLEPLDHEWTHLNKAKTEFSKEKETIYLSRESLKQEIKELADEWIKVSKALEKSNKNLHETEQAKLDIHSLKAMAEKEYELAKEERIEQTKIIERERENVRRLQLEYENGLSVIQSEEKIVKEKEEDLIIREKLLADRQAMLERNIARQNNGTTN